MMTHATSLSLSRGLGAMLVGTAAPEPPGTIDTHYSPRTAIGT